jgi:cytochrome c-type biogenesis protein CcmH/NrfG
MLGAFLGAGLTTVNAIATDWLFWAAAGVIASTTSHQTAAGLGASTDAPQATPKRGKSVTGRRKTTTESIIVYACLAVGLVVALRTVSAVEASRAASASQLARLQSQSQLAIDLALRSTRSDPQRPQYWDTLGLAYVSADRFGDASTAFERASKLAPYDVRYDGDLARALATLAQKGDQAAAGRAVDVAEHAVRTDSNNPLAHQTRAVVMQVTGNLPEALRSSERALALDRTSSAGFTTNRAFYVTGVQVLTALGRPAEAISLARRGMARLPDDVTRGPVRIELARALLADGQAAAALIEIDAVLALRPNDATAQQVRAQIRAALGN